MKGNDFDKCVLTSQRDIFRDFYTRHLYLIMASSSSSKGCFVWYVCKDVHKMRLLWGHFLKIMKDANVTLF